MTQEQLAEQLGVSVDAIGKYERSLSFIRGDLEYRLSDRLGWSQADVIACRKDWGARRKPANSRYRLLDDTLVETVFEGSWRAACLASIAMADAELHDLPSELEPNVDVFLPIYEIFRSHWAAIMCDGAMVAKWTLPFLLPEDEALFRAGRLIECDLSVDRLRRPILPGTYFGYCPALIVRPGHEAASSLLMSSFVGFLETLAEREVFLHGLGTISVSPSGAQICRDIGMIRLGTHSLSPEFVVWNLPGSRIPGSIFGRRSTFLRQRYCEAFG
ncbi:helix-turn-helix domain-containing protein [Ruegeria sp. 2012CJ15-1]